MSYSNEEIKALIEEVEWQIGAVEKPSAINCNKMLEVIKQLRSKVNNFGVLDNVSVSSFNEVIDFVENDLSAGTDDYTREELYKKYNER